MVQAGIDRSDIAGAVTLVARHGKIAHREAVGQQDNASGTPMRPDTIFRIYSMTKPITAVATLLLYEEGQYWTTLSPGSCPNVPRRRSSCARPRRASSLPTLSAPAYRLSYLFEVLVNQALAE
jgi:hypothetical protein